MSLPKNQSGQDTWLVRIRVPETRLVVEVDFQHQWASIVLTRKKIRKKKEDDFYILTDFITEADLGWVLEHPDEELQRGPFEAYMDRQDNVRIKFTRGVYRTSYTITKEQISLVRQVGERARAIRAEFYPDLTFVDESQKEEPAEKELEPELGAGGDSETEEVKGDGAA